VPARTEAAVWIEAWRHVAAGEMARVYRAEHARHLAALDWDTAATWNALESARTVGAVAGLVARDHAGAVVGWTFFVVRDGELQVGAFTASREAREPLLTALLGTAEARRAGQVRVFGATCAPGLAAALASRGFAVGAYHYLTAALPVLPRPDGGASWRPADLAPAAALLQRCYADPDPLRPFGGAGRLDDWMAYVLGLTTTAGCGVFAPELSVVERTPAGAIDALALVTRLGPAAAHLAQCAVAPQLRGRGTGGRVLDQAMQRAAAAGLTAMTLLVAADNTTARGLYAGRGFRYAASFLSAVAVAAPVSAPAVRPALAARA